MDHDIKTEAHQFLVGEMIAACALHFQTLDKPWRSMRQSDQQDLLADQTGTHPGKTPRRTSG